jgi:hypothetical protein
MEKIYFHVYKPPAIDRSLPDSIGSFGSVAVGHEGRGVVHGCLWLT